MGRYQRRIERPPIQEIFVENRLILAIDTSQISSLEEINDFVLKNKIKLGEENIRTWEKPVDIPESTPRGEKKKDND